MNQSSDYSTQLTINAITHGVHYDIANLKIIFTIFEHVLQMCYTHAIILVLELY